MIPGKIPGIIQICEDLIPGPGLLKGISTLRAENREIDQSRLKMKLAIREEILTGK